MSDEATESDSSASGEAAAACADSDSSLSGLSEMSTAAQKARRQVDVTSQFDNVLTRLEKLKGGPLALLYAAMSERRRVRVVVRGPRNVRSILSAFVTLFDKHFNLALTDVDEYCCQLARRSRDARRRASPQRSRSSASHVRFFHRHVSQLFLKGDNVVIVSFFDQLSLG